MLVALVRSSADKRIGVALPLNTAAPLGVAQIEAVLDGKLMLKESPHTVMNRGRYEAEDIRYAMQAISGKPISNGSTGGPCACSASGACSLYPVARESQKFPPKNAAWVAL